ncbi:hypothetical protein I5T99_06990 [Stenotrophomonas maltophilia]|nr:hypothetical protein [Stenotrophomonas maltophilia]
MRAFGYTQTVKYEVARDLLNRKRALLSARLGRERNSEQPDAFIVDQIRADMRAVAGLMRQLDVCNEPALDAIILAHQ